MKQNPVAMPPLDNGNTVPLPLDLYCEPIVVRQHGNDNVLGQGAPVDRQMLRRRSGGFLGFLKTIIARSFDRG
jgi:hypothetical protein